MATRSVQSPVRTALMAGVQALLAADAETDVRVSYAYEPARNDREKIFTDRPRASTPPAAIRSGRNAREESGEFDVIVIVAGVNESPEWCDQRAQDLGGYVEDYLADHKSNEMGVDGLSWIRADSWELTNLAADRGSLTELKITVRYNARLT